MSLAKLGIEVTSKGAAKATSELKNLSGAAEMAETAALGSAKGSKQMAAAAAGIAPAMSKAATATKAFAATNDNVRSMGGSMSGLAAQFQDIGVTASMGMSPMMIALQQGTQIAGQMEMALQGGSSALGVLGQAFRSLLSPVSLISIALTAVLAAGIQMVDWANVASFTLNKMANFLDAAYDELMIFAGGLAITFAPAILSSIRGMTVAVGTGLVGAFRALGAAILANPIVALGVILAGALVAAYKFRDEITQALGFDIFNVMKGYWNAIIGTVIGAFNAIMKASEVLPGKFGAISQAISHVFIENIKDMAREVVSIINGLITDINGLMREMSLDSLQVGLLPPPAQMFPPSAAPEGMDGLARSVQDIQNAFNAAQGDWVGAGLSALQDGVKTVTQGMRDLAASAMGAGDEMAKAGSKGAAGMAEANQSAEFARGVFKGFFSDLRQGLQNGESFWQAFGNAALNVLDKIIGKIEDQLVDALLKATNIGGGGGGGWLGSIFGGLFGGGTFSSFGLAMPYANGGAFSGGREIAFANGGVVSGPTNFPMSGGNMGLMGEAGPEAIMPLKRGPDGRLGVEMTGGGGQQSGRAEVHVAVSVANDGSLQAYVNKTAEDKAVSVSTEVSTRMVESYDSKLSDRIQEIGSREAPLG
ncbi:phage tail length tape measure family protein [Pseudovibrio exalbescens]|uniref:phage tail length tape measure family protein n=1 Tax=Pseudovibrio exalbescens TaxID=197461 RepID=UPI000C9C3ECA|nr:phage tail length tape measure family protein [Pseudovibrio exalbescens]